MEEEKEEKYNNGNMNKEKDINYTPKQKSLWKALKYFDDS